MSKSNFEYKKLHPFKWFILENYPFLEDLIDALNNYQLFCKLGEMYNKQIDNINALGTQTEELTEAYNNFYDWFENLDVQDEINNKLDEMVEDGTFINLLTSYMPYVTPEMYGAVGDGETDDYNAIYQCLTENKKINFGINKTYYISTPLLLDNVDNIIINGNNATLKFNGASSESVGNKGYIEFDNSENIKISDLNIDGGITWITRPYSWDTADYNTYNNLRLRTYDGFNFTECENVYINNCKAKNVKVGFHYLYTTNGYLNDSISSYTMADSVLIHGGSKYINVYNHYVEYANDDQFSIVHETNDSDLVENCSFTNCNAINSFGSCCVMQEAINCFAINCTSIDNKSGPIKLGSALGTYGCKNCTMDNIKVVSSNTIQGTSANLTTAVNNGTFTIATTSGSNINNENCQVLNSEFIETSGNNLSLFNPNHNGLQFKNCIFKGINLVFVDTTGTKFEDCEITSNDGNVFTRSSFTFRNCKITDAVNYTARGTRPITANGCDNLVFDNVELSGLASGTTDLLNLYGGSTTRNNVYLKTNDTNVTINNTNDVHCDGIITLDTIDRYSYARFREGQILYFKSNHGLYVIVSGAWTKLNS